MNNEQMAVVLGTVAMEPKGEYNSSTYYDKLNTVTYNEYTYMAKQPCQNILPTNTDYWQKISGGIAPSEIVDNLDSTATNQPLSANQGKILGDDIKDIKSVVKFHTIHKSSATYIIEFPNGKNLIVDTGLANQWTDIKAAIDGLGITKVDYVIITHFHPDHKGNLQNLIDNYDVENAQWYVQMKPDYVNHSGDIDDTETTYDNTINLLTSNGITPIVPTNDSYVTVDTDIKLHFLNTDATLAENYYNTNGEWYTSGKPNFNAFSLVTEVIHKKVKMLFTGDLEEPTERQITKFLGKCNVMTMPHHGVNRDSYLPFYQATMPDYSIAQYIDGTIADTPENWVRNEFTSFMNLKRLNSKIITAKWSKSINGLFTFISNGYELSSNVLDSGIAEGKLLEHTIYSRPEELIKYSTQLASTITLMEFIGNMALGSIYQGLISDTFATRYPVIYNDLQTIFGNLFDANFKLEIYTDYSVSNAYVIKLYDRFLEFTATKIGSGSWQKKGTGRLSNITGETNLITLLEKLPQGFYNIPSYTDDDSTILATDGAYQLNVTLDYNSGTYVQGSILATRRYSGETTDCTVANAWFNTNQGTNKITWRKLV